MQQSTRWIKKIHKIKNTRSHTLAHTLYTHTPGHSASSCRHFVGGDQTSHWQPIILRSHTLESKTNTLTRILHNRGTRVYIANYLLYIHVSVCVCVTTLLLYPKLWNAAPWFECDLNWFQIVNWIRKCFVNVIETVSFYKLWIYMTK